MKRLKIALLFAFALLMLAACGGEEKEKPITHDAQRDSVLAENQRLNEFIDIVATTMDSINGREKMIFVTREGKRLTNKHQIRDNIKVFEYTLNEQRKRIAELERQLANRNDVHSQQFRTIIASLQQQLDEKEAMIAQLRAELNSKNVDIANLQNHVAQLNENVTTLTQENTEKTTDLRRANEEISQMSTGYVLIATKKQLSNAGLLKSGGLLSKKKLDMTEVDVSMFRSVDTRQATQFTIGGKNAKVLTTHPASSYVLEDHGSSATLRITNASSFWGTSRYLVVQYK